MSNENYYNITTEFYEIIVPNNHKVAVYVFNSVSNSHDRFKGNMYFIHGVGGCANIWKHQIQYFTAKFWTIISIDLLGHGKSAKLKLDKEYNFQQLVIDALYIFDQFISESENIIVGHSYGCSIATYVAHERKDLISRMVLISGGSPTPLGSPPCLFYMCDCFLKCIHQFIIHEFRRRAFTKNKLSTVSKKEKSIAVNIDSKTLKWMMFGQIWDEGDEKYHSRIYVPTLLIHGANDQFVTCEEEYEMLSVLPTATFRTIENSGHMAMLEQPDQVNKYIEEHILQNWEFALTLPQNQLSIENNNNDVPKRHYRATKLKRKSWPTDNMSYHINLKNSKFEIKKNKIQPLNSRIL